MRLIDADKAIEIWKEKDFIKLVGQEEKAKMLLDVLPTEPRWILVSDPLNELPKDRWLYVTTKVGCIETLFYDMTEWSDEDIARSTIAYMDYYEPQPYEAESEVNADGVD